MDETEFQFQGPAFGDAELMALPDLETVELLGLWDTAVTDRGFRELLRARALVEISIISDLLSGYVLQVLAQLPALRSLQIHRGPNIGDDGVRHLSSAVELRELYLNETMVTDDGLVQIRNLPHLWSLLLDDTTVSDSVFTALSSLPQLSLLSLNRTRVTGIGLADLPDNEYFSLCLDSTLVTDGAVAAFAEHRANLKLISLNETSVGNDAARALAKLTTLDDVRLSGTALTDDGLAAFAGHPHLEVIYVEGCKVTKRAVKALKASNRGLTVYGP